MATVSSESYDAIPYDSDPFPLTHPRHTAALAHLFGLETPQLDKCRVLELGCAAGGNLIPMAVELPEARFVGIDLSAKQVAAGNDLVKRLNLDNVELRHASITDFGPEEGQFDYIICHGVFSWVPRPVQESIIKICKQNLSANGIAYVSYNTYPGWHMRGVVRDMMKYHVEQFNDPRTRIQQARCLLNFLTDSVGQDAEAYQKVLSDEARILSRHTDTYLFHEHLEEVNEPCYFYEFADRIDKIGLQYLGDAEFPTMLARNFKASTFEILRDVPMLQQEQYMDFLRNRMFRRTLICHEGIKLVRAINSNSLMDLYLASCPPMTFSDPLLDSEEPAEFRGTVGITTVRQPITKAALIYFGEQAPRHVHFEELFESSIDRVRPFYSGARQVDAARTKELLAADLITILGAGLIQVVSQAPQFQISISQRPVASQLARLQAHHGYKVTNRRHELVNLEGFSRHMIHRLDGSHDRRSLAYAIQKSMRDGSLAVKQGDSPISNMEPATIDSVVDSTLRMLAQHALLVA